MNCSICGRPLVNWQDAKPDDPAMDCGGDCLSCVQSAETISRPHPPESVKLAAKMAAAPAGETHDRLRREWVEASIREAKEHAGYIFEKRLRRRH